MKKSKYKLVNRMLKVPKEEDVTLLPVQIKIDELLNITSKLFYSNPFLEDVTMFALNTLFESVMSNSLLYGEYYTTDGNGIEDFISLTDNTLSNDYRKLYTPKEYDLLMHNMGITYLTLVDDSRPFILSLLEDLKTMEFNRKKLIGFHMETVYFNDDTYTSGIAVFKIKVKK